MQMTTVSKWNLIALGKLWKEAWNKCSRVPPAEGVRELAVISDGGRGVMLIPQALQLAWPKSRE